MTSRLAHALLALAACTGCGGPGDDSACTPVSWTVDLDGDGYGGEELVTACVAPAGAVQQAGDCDDGDPAINPVAVEDCDGVDNDCDGVLDPQPDGLFYDLDLDGYGDPDAPVTSCQDAGLGVADAGDCDDDDPAVSPAAVEVCDDGIDNDCDGLVDPSIEGLYLDLDLDGYGDPGQPVASCAEVGGAVADDRDCDDTDPAVHPGAYEVCDDGVDNDCDGQPACALDERIDADDADGFVTDHDPEADMYGWYLATIGDTDGDGAEELAWMGRFVGKDGESYLEVTWGSAPDSIVQTRVVARDPVPDFGACCAQPGPLEVDGDGYDDLAVWATRSDIEDYTEQYSELLVFQGPIGDELDLEDPALRVVGSHYRDSPGRQTAQISKPGDGTGAVLALGSSGSADPGTGTYNVGAVWVLEVDPTDRVDYSTTDASASIWGAYEGGRVGYAVVALDVDGDGQRDLAVTRHGNTLEFGESSPSSIGIFLSPLDGTRAFEDYDGGVLQDEHDGLGATMVSTEDTNGDGLEDLWASGGNAELSDGRQGRVHLYSGDTLDTVSSDDSDSLFTVELNNGGSEPAVATGDIDCDGVTDFLIGVYREGEAVSSGQAYAFYGPQAGVLTVEDADVTWYTDERDEKLGGSLAVANIDGDACDDVAISAPGYPSGDDVGAVFLFFGHGF